MSLSESVVEFLWVMMMTAKTKMHSTGAADEV